MDLKKTVKDIKDLKIQGAENIAISSVEAIRRIGLRSKFNDVSDYLNELHSARISLQSTRPTEPCLRNSLKFVFQGINLKTYSEIKDKLIHNVNLVVKHFSDSKQKIAEIGAKKISNGMIVYTHCHSSTVMDILKLAKKKGKKFVVHNTETRPKFQGRITARELSSYGIKVKHFVDSAAKLAIKESDIMFFGADAITSEGEVINKIGSELFSLAAERYSVPVYSCTDSWKFDPESVFGYNEDIEIRKSSEIWDKAPKNVTVSNYAFEKIDPDLVTGIISELGVYSPEIIVEELRRNYGWMFRRI